MTRGAIQPMKSSELALSAAPVLCFVCDASNTLDAEYCRRCSAPMALAHQACGQTTRPQIVAILGPGGAGKTVYLGMLMDMLSHQPQRLQFVARGAFSIGLQQTAMSALARCEFPAKTSRDPERWNWMHCEIRREEIAGEGNPPSFLARFARFGPRSCRPDTNKRPCVELVIPDMAGEAIIEEVDHPQTFSLVRSLLEKSAAVLLLLDAWELSRGQRDPDFAAMKILNCLKEIEIQGRVGRTSRRSVGLVFTKVDQVQGCRDNPEEFAHTYAAGTWELCRQGFRDYAFFAASVVGCCTWMENRGESRRRIPLRVEPHGVIEPFEWLLEKLCPQRRT